MPRKRQPKEIWNNTRLRILQRDGYKCTRCDKIVMVSTAHIDHVQSGKIGSNGDDNLRTLCKICHATRADHRHQGLTAKLVRSGELPPDWRKLVWED